LKLKELGSRSCAVYVVRSRQAPLTVVSRQLKVRIEVDLRVIATCDSQEEEDKNLKFSPEFTHGIRSQEREADDDQVEMNITCDPEYHELRRERVL
jgi:hypothetical protein